jgi:hypothetical protein
VFFRVLLHSKRISGSVSCTGGGASLTCSNDSATGYCHTRPANGEAAQDQQSANRVRRKRMSQTDSRGSWIAFGTRNARCQADRRCVQLLSSYLRPDDFAAARLVCKSWAQFLSSTLSSLTFHPGKDLGGNRSRLRCIRKCFPLLHRLVLAISVRITNEILACIVDELQELAQLAHLELRFLYPGLLQPTTGTPSDISSLGKLSNLVSIRFYGGWAPSVATIRALGSCRKLKVACTTPAP